MLERDSREQRNEWQMAHAVEVHGLEKAFAKLAVITGVSLDVRRGELFGLIGPSGCGKTTLVRVIAGLARPSAGRVRVLGTDPLQHSIRERERTGYMPQGSFLFPNLTVLQNARFVAGLYGMGWLRRRRRIREMLERFELWSARGRRTSQLSGGMQRRLGLACAVLHDPELVLIDEPTAGLDPILRGTIWAYLHGLRDKGTTIVLTTQYVEEAAYCDRVAVMHRGRIVATGTPAELRREALYGEVADIEGEGFNERAVEALRRLLGMYAVERRDHGLRIVVDDLATATPRITELLLQHGTEVHSIKQQTPTFDQVFTDLIARHG